MKEDITCVFEGVAGVGGIYISNLKAAQNASVLNRFGIKAIVTAVKGGVVRHTKDDVPDHLYIPAYDVPTQDISKYFEETYQFIDSVRRKTNVLVHCYAGISRSATIVIAYLLRKYNYSLENVITMVKRRRSKINPNRGFIEQLKQEALKMGIPIVQKSEEFEEILKPKASSPVKHRAVSAYTKRKLSNRDEAMERKTLLIKHYKENKNNAEESIKESLTQEKKKQFQEEVLKQKYTEQEQRRKQVEPATVETEGASPLLKNMNFDELIESSNNGDYLNLFSPTKSKYHSYSKSAMISEPLQESKVLNPKMTSKIEKFKEKVLLLEEKRRRKSRSDLNGFENRGSSLTSKKQIVSPDFESAISKKLYVREGCNVLGLQKLSSPSQSMKMGMAFVKSARQEHRNF